MTRKLRKELFKIMRSYSNLKHHQISFSNSSVRDLTKKEIEDALEGIDFSDESTQMNDLKRGI